MAEAVGLTSALLALTMAAYKTSIAVHETVTSFRNQGKTIRTLQDDTKSLVDILQHVQEQVQNDEKDIQRHEVLRQPVYSCLSVCRELSEMMDACSIRSTDKQQSFRDWARMQYQGKNLMDLKERLSSYKSTLGVAFGLAAIQHQSISQSSLEQIKETIEETKGDLEYQLANVQRKLDGAEDYFEALQEDQARLQSCLDSLLQSQETANKGFPSLVIQDNQGAGNSRAIFGTDHSNPQFNLTVTGNIAGNNAVMASGVHRPETLQELLRGPQQGDLARIIQALSAHASGSDPKALLSLANQLNSQRSAGGSDTYQQARLVPSDSPSGDEIISSPQTSFKSEAELLQVDSPDQRME